MNKKQIDVESTVKVNETFFEKHTRLSTDERIKLRGLKAEVIENDLSPDRPYKIKFENGYTVWVDPCEIYVISKPNGKYTPEEILALLLQGFTFKTASSNTIHMVDGKAKFNEEPLNWELVKDLVLTTEPNPPFKIDSVKGTHCKVWDSNPKKVHYRLIVNYDKTSQYPYRDSSLVGWENAVPV